MHQGIWLGTGGLPPQGRHTGIDTAPGVNTTILLLRPLHRCEQLHRAQGSGEAILGLLVLADQITPPVLVNPKSRKGLESQGLRLPNLCL